MSISKNIIILLIANVSFFLSNSIFSQQQINCGTDLQMEKYHDLQPKSMARGLAKKQFIQQFMALNSNKESNSSYVIPVVFHVFGKEFNDNTTVTDEIIMDALERSNEDFQGLTPDYNTIDHPFDVIKKSMNISFELARLDPDSNLTTGILYHEERAGFGDGFQYIEREIQQYAWDNYTYMNIYIMRDLYDDLDYSNSGVAWYPDTGMSDHNIARVVYNGSYLGNNTDENFRSVLTHEFGHWLDLRHTFQGGCTTENDLVDDTPPQISNSANTNCEVIYNCNDNEVNNENFMDYTDCYKMFTIGQTERMNAALHLPSRNTLWQESNLIATGLMNFTEKPGLVLSSRSVFEEMDINDGTITNQVEIRCIDCTFSGIGSLTNVEDYVLSNLPEGLEASVEVRDDSTVVINLTGRASVHEKENSVTDLEITFTDQAIAGQISDLHSNKIKGIKVDFLDTYTSYCLPRARFRIYSHITNFTLDGISSPSGYEDVVDFSNIRGFVIKKNNQYDVAITLNRGYGGDVDKSRVRIWADWNQDLFYADNELMVSETYSIIQSDEEGNYQISASLEVPSSALSGDTKMRVLVHHVLGNDGDTSCDVIESGESEDYRLRIYEDDQPFIVDFIGGPSRVNFSEPVSFFDLSTAGPSDEIVSREWEFPGGMPSTSSAQNPIVLYPSEGSHDATLSVTTANGNTLSRTVPDIVTSSLYYCQPTLRFGGYFNITHVDFNAIDHSPGLNDYHNYYDEVSTDLNAGETYPLSLTVVRGAGNPTDINRVRVWADWNYNSRFDEYELMFSKIVTHSDYDGNGEYVINEEIRVPLTAVQAQVGIRVMGHFVSGTEGDSPCDQIDSGNSSDYKLNILEADDHPFTVDFVGGPLKIRQNQSVYFSDVSAPASGDEVATRLWEFPGGVPSTSTELYPVINYPDPGIYDVTLTVGTERGESKSRTVEDMIPVSPDYCQPTFRSGARFNITHVDFNAIDHSPGLNDYHNYYDAVSTDLKAGETYPLSLTVVRGAGSPTETNRVRVWADWNYNSIFDEYELMFSKIVTHSDYDGNGEYVINEEIRVPLTAVQAQVAIRVMGHLVSETEGDSPCDQVHSGNSSDYRLNILEADDHPFTVDFVGRPLKIRQSQSVYFSDVSAPASGDEVATRLWEFPGGVPSTSTELYPVINYPDPGIYDVTLTVGTERGESKSRTVEDMISVSPDYCQPTFRYGTYFNITHVVFNAIDHSPGLGDYHNYYHEVSTDLKAGETYPLSFTVVRGEGSPTDINRVRVWADWNYNSIFDEYELMFSKIVTHSDYDGNGEYVINEEIRVPLTAVLGQVGIRVLGHFVSGTEGDSPCDEVDSGNSSDYRLNILEADDHPFTVDFVGDPLEIRQNQSVYFSDVSAPASGDEVATRLWEFPGGVPSTSTELYPVINYPDPGIYDVTLTVGTERGESKSRTVEDMIPVSPDYCQPTFRDGARFNTTHVDFNAIDHSPGLNDYHNYYDEVSTDLKAGETYPLSLTVVRGAGSPTETNRVRVWADWNYNGRFDEYELMFSKIVTHSDYDGNGEYVINEEIRVPLTAVQAQVGMRVLGHFVSGTEGDSPCDEVDSGNSSDYKLNILEADDHPFTVDFVGDPLEIRQNQSVYFSDVSAPASGDEVATRLWEFPGGVPSTSTELYPVINYPDPGIYDVTLTIGTERGESKSRTVEDMIPVSPDYCQPTFRDGARFNTTHVDFNAIDHSPGLNDYHNYYDEVSTDLKAGETYPLSFTVVRGEGSPTDINRVRVWADWNYNSRFDEYELMFSKIVTHSDYDGNGEYVINEEIRVPLTAVQAQVGMRVLGHFVSGTEGDSPCDEVDSGNSSDYKLNILEADDHPFTVDFVGDPLKIRQNQSVYFSDVSAPASGDEVATRLWEFPGGVPSTSTELYPVINYPDPGIYDVTLTIGTERGESKSRTVEDMIPVSPDYCQPTFRDGARFNTTHVDFNAIDHSPGLNDYHNYYDEVSTDLKAGETYPLSLTVVRGAGSPTETNRVRVWADWNYNSRFDEYELMFSKIVTHSDYDGNGEYVINEEIRVPLTAVQAQVGMRVLGHFVSGTEGDSPCDEVDSGNSSDYKLNILEADDHPFTVDFVGDPLKIRQNQSVYFSDVSAPASGDEVATRLWEFPGGVPSTSTELYPVINYPDPGIYDVTLTIGTERGESKSRTVEDMIPVSPDYCQPTFRDGARFNTTHVDFNAIDHSPGLNDYHNYYDEVSTDLKAGETYPLSFTVVRGEGSPTDINRVRVWADWNYNSRFDEYELMFSKIVTHSDYDGNGEYVINEEIRVPLTAVQAQVGMRVLGHFVSGTEGDSPCDEVDSGNSSDYKLNILEADDHPFTVDFVGDPLKIRQNQSVYFSDVSAPASGDEVATRLWEFPGGVPSTSTELYPVINYPDPGIYDVTLTVGTERGESKSRTVEDMIPVSPDYCQPTFRDGARFNTTHVDFNAIDHSPGLNDYHNYYDAVSTDLKAGETYPLSLTVVRGAGSPTETNRVRVWADWNYNGRFDEYELMFSKIVTHSDYDGNGEYVINEEIRVPLTAVQAQVGMRVLGHFVSGTEGDSPCDEVDSGNSSDYRLNILEADDHPFTVDFVGGPLKIRQSQSVYFSDVSAPASGDEVATRLWEFPGGVPSTSTELYPVINYPDPGIYDVTLTVGTERGESKSRTVEDMIPVSPDYCQPTFRDGARFNITHVDFNAIDHSPESDNYHNYYDAVSTDLNAGETYLLSLTVVRGAESPTETNRVRVWADWNYDSRFDEYELMFSKIVTSSDYDGNGEYVINEEIRVPLTTVQGQVGMRVLGHFVSGTEGDSPCDQVDSGNSFDYRLNITETSLATTPPDILVYPNPFKSRLNIKMINDYLGKIDITVLSLDGKFVFYSNEYEKSNKHSKLMIDLSKFPSGNFIIQFEMNDRVYTEKVIKY